MQSDDLFTPNRATKGSGSLEKFSLLIIERKSCGKEFYWKGTVAENEEVFIPFTKVRVELVA